MLAEGMLINGYEGPARAALIEFLIKNHGNLDIAAQKWACDQNDLSAGPWRGEFNALAKQRS